MAELITINPYNPDPRLLSTAARKIRSGGIAVIPTDTTYAIVCCASTRDSIKRLQALKGVASEGNKKPMSVLFSDIATVTEYTMGLSNQVYRAMRRTLPGPYTFILNASSRISAKALKRRKTIGVRIPDNPVTLAILSDIGGPLLSTSVEHTDEDHPLDDPIEICRTLDNAVDLVVDVGPIYPEESTVVDFTENVAVVVREGKGSLDLL
tara:strand:- start:161 stop:787 length:627 start_codon:yes stop_codon:yes gene_type:complete